MPRKCPMTFVPVQGEEKPCTREGVHGPFHATDRETVTRIPGGAWVKLKQPKR